MKVLSRKLLVTIFSALFCLTVWTSLGFSGEKLSDLGKAISRLIDSTKVSVVTVVAKVSHEVYVEKESGIMSLFKSERQKQAISYVNVGTGVIIDDAGHIITRSSIVLDADYRSVTLVSGEELPAQFVAHDPETGFAVIKVDHDGLRPARLGNSDHIHAGIWILMIGNSLGAFPSVDFGAINGIRNDGMLQVSANLNPGNNGSPVINLQGEVVGLVAGRFNAPDTFASPFNGYAYSGVILAFPVNRVKRIAADLIEVGYVRKGWLGVVGYADDRQPLIRKIKENSPAKRAGLTVGDVVVSFGNWKVENMSDLIRLVENTLPGETVPIEFVRQGERHVTEIEIGEKARGYGAEVNTTLRTANPVNHIDTIRNERRQLFPMDLFERNRLLEKRIDYLEKELLKLKEIVHSN